MRTLALCTLLALLFTGCTSKKTIEFDFSPPLEEVAVEADELSIDPTKSQLVHFENGTSVDVPKDAFVDKEGNVVTAPVTLALTNYDNPAAILASGIPMAYHDGDQQQDFESAGMFQIKGFAAGKEVMIQEGKELGINYPSATAGDYDFFYLEEREEDGAKKAAWTKLNGSDAQEAEAELTPTGLGDYQLQFDTASYPELAELESIQWRVASKHSNPLDKENAWVLDKKWASVELTQPKYGLGNALLTDSLHNYYYSPIFMADRTRIIVPGKTSVNIWDTAGTLIKHIEHAERFGRASLISEKYLLVHFEDGEGIFDSNGKLVCKLEEGYSHRVIPSERTVIFTKRGESNTILFYDFDGNKIKELTLGQRAQKFWPERLVFSQFLVSPEKELIINSEKGISICSIKGAEKQHKEGKYHSIKYLSPQTLLIEEMDGRLTVWNWKTNKQTSSELDQFNTVSKLIDNTRYSSYNQTIPHANLVVVREAHSEKDIFWNYETGRVLDLNGEFYSYRTDSNQISQLLTYNRESNTCKLYNLPTQNVVLEVSDADWAGEGAPFEITYSMDYRYFLLSGSNHSALYGIDGALVKNFKDYDSTIINTFFTEHQLIKSISRKGVLYTWDLQGNKIRTKQLEYSNLEYVFSQPSFGIYNFPKNGFEAWGNRLSGTKYFNVLGQLQMTGNLRYGILDSNSTFTVDQNELRLRNRFNLHKQAFQIRLATESESFDTYIFLSKEDQEKLDRYNTIRTQRLNAEKDRKKKEAAVVRSFAIKNFGIYNWDRFYKDESRVLFAASFDFGVPTDFNSITVFLITEVNGPSVIKFYEGSWEKFSIDPKVNNQLLAVLPENRVAHLSNKELQQLDWAAIEQNGKYEFHMNVSNETVKNLVDLDKVLQ